MEKQYEELTTKFITDMEAVGGSLRDFVDGMEYAGSAVLDRYHQAAAELKSQEDEG